ncbi:MAG: hypothetical protein IPG56_18110 [Caulobacteraceae bacterium]|nr:hypothetical protein [Caulobacteraceae bacterium]
MGGGGGGKGGGGGGGGGRPAAAAPPPPPQLWRTHPPPPPPPNPPPPQPLRVGSVPAGAGVHPGAVNTHVLSSEAREMCAIAIARRELPGASAVQPYQRRGVVAITKCAFEAGVAVVEGGVVVWRVFHREDGWRVRIAHRRKIVPMANRRAGVWLSQHRENACGEEEMATGAIDCAHCDHAVAHVGSATADDGLCASVLRLFVIAEEVHHRRSVLRRLLEQACDRRGARHNIGPKAQRLCVLNDRTLGFGEGAERNQCSERPKNKCRRSAKFYPGDVNVFGGVERDWRFGFISARGDDEVLPVERVGRAADHREICRAPPAFGDASCKRSRFTAHGDEPVWSIACADRIHRLARADQPKQADQGGSGGEDDEKDRHLSWTSRRILDPRSRAR